MAAPELLITAIDHVRAERYAEAELLLRDVLEAEPDDPYALFLLGNCALLAGRSAEAAGLLERALAFRPAHRSTRILLARAQLAAGRPVEVLTTLESLAADPHLAQVHSLRGTALNSLQRPSEAIEAFRVALAAAPDDPEALLNCGNAHAELGDPALAETMIRRAIACRPELAEAHASLGHLLAEAGRLDEAIEASEAAIALQPDMAAAHWNQGVAHLLNGNFPAGWRKYEWRKRHFPASFANPAGPRWEGEDLTGRTILVIAEQGLGDTIMFARYLPLLAARGAEVVLECAGSLTPLLGTLPGVRAVAWGEEVEYDCWVDQMSLPLLFGTTPETIPMPNAYLRPDPVRAARWDARLPPGLRVGIAWAGNPRHSNDRRRSIPAQALAALVGIGQKTLVSLQYGPRAQDFQRLFGIADNASRLKSWADTAALVSQLDLVISVDTAVAHLAGALGIPVWLLLPHAPDWRWMLKRNDSPWYAGMRLFRQERPGDWAGVVDRVAIALAGVSRPSYTMAMPPLTWSVAPVTQPASAEAR
jgi:tetratricopeptide (TPR) repeat protein